MSKVNSLFQDEMEWRMAEWLKEHPGATEEEAHEAIYPQENEAPFLYPWRKE